MRILLGRRRRRSEIRRYGEDAMGAGIESHSASSLPGGDRRDLAKVVRVVLVNHRDRALTVAGKRQTGRRVEGGTVDALTDRNGREKLSRHRVRNRHHFAVTAAEQPVMDSV